MQNLRYYCRQRIEALSDKQCKFGCIYRVRFENIIVQSANIVQYQSFLHLILRNVISKKEYTLQMK